MEKLLYQKFELLSDKSKEQALEFMEYLLEQDKKRFHKRPLSEEQKVLLRQCLERNNAQAKPVYAE